MVGHDKLLHKKVVSNHCPTKVASSAGMVILVPWKIWGKITKGMWHVVWGH